MGSYKNPDIVQEEKLKRISSLLKNVTVEVMSFEKIVDMAKESNSNSDSEFIKNLYKNFNISFVRAKRLINSDAQGRGEINEVVITNY